MDQSGAPIHESRFSCRGCGYSLTGATIGGVCPECGKSIEESLAAVGAGQVPAANLPKLSFVGPILITILCCLIGGIVAIVYTSNANTAAVAGNKLEYESARKKRDGWMLASILIALTLVILQIGLAGGGF